MSSRPGRRTVVKQGFGLGVTLSLTPALTFAQDNPAAVRPKAGDLLIKVDDPMLKPLTPDDIAVGAAQIMAWAVDPSDKIVRSGSRLNRVLLLRLDESTLKPDTRSRAAGGVVAYTAICTHTGCDVTDWLPEGMLYCPCHFTKYDPKDGAAVVDGPAPRPLPALPLTLVDGQLTVAAPFTARVAFEQG
jgi:rieske iron-sulfur protein